MASKIAAASHIYRSHTNYTITFGSVYCTFLSGHLQCIFCTVKVIGRTSIKCVILRPNQHSNFLKTCAHCESICGMYCNYMVFCLLLYAPRELLNVKMLNSVSIVHILAKESTACCLHCTKWILIFHREYPHLHRQPA